jgi:ADP-ribose pyrophosphatase YjhB (NUDIX family)
MMDVKIDSVEGKFKFRVCGIVRVNNKYLTVKIQNNDFYCLPGGHVELGEDTDSAVLREMKEELGYEVKIVRLVSIIQNFFKAKDGRNFHELGYYYIVEPVNIDEVNLEDYIRMENDKGEMKRLEFRWFTLEELKNTRFLPEILKSKLEGNTLENIITKD